MNPQTRTARMSQERSAHPDAPSVVPVPGEARVGLLAAPGAGLWVAADRR